MDQATVVNTMVNTLMLHRRKRKEKSRVQHTNTHTHTDIFKFTSDIFNSAFMQEWSQNNDVMDLLQLP